MRLWDDPGVLPKRYICIFCEFKSFLNRFTTPPFLVFVNRSGFEAESESNYRHFFNVNLFSRGDEGSVLFFRCIFIDQIWKPWPPNPLKVNYVPDSKHMEVCACLWVKAEGNPTHHLQAESFIPPTCNCTNVNQMCAHSLEQSCLIDSIWCSPEKEWEKMEKDRKLRAWMRKNWTYL